MEREPFNFDELFKGNWNLFKEAFKNPRTAIVYDADGIIIDLPRTVFERFTEKYKIPADPSEANAWNYLRELAIKNQLAQGEIDTAEDDWYDPWVISTAQRYLYIKPVIDQTIRLFGAERNFVLTSREPEFSKVTFDWFKDNIPEIWPGNIFIRSEKREKPTNFKAREIKSLAKSAPWVVFFEDSTKYVKAVLDANIPNCLVVNVPVGAVKPDFDHPNLFVVGRYPRKLQGMYTVYAAISKAIRS